jgi:hypothetical protein
MAELTGGRLEDIFDTSIKILFPDTTGASFPAVTTLRSSLSMYFLYIISFFSLLVLLTAHLRSLSN